MMKFSKRSVNIKGSLPNLRDAVNEAVNCVVLASFASHMLTLIFPSEAADPLFIFICMPKMQPA